MNNFVICTDSACDLSPKTLGDMGVRYAELTFRFDGEEAEYSNYSVETKAFYDKMRAGGVARTSAPSTEKFTQIFTEILDTGADVLHIAFSSGLSATYNSARIAANALHEKYPERKIEVIDTLCASAGEGLILYLAVEKKKEGASFDEIVSFLKETAPNVCHWFTVDDLVYLKRGGRVSPLVAFVGNIMGIKPVLHVDDEGHLINVAKARGRKNAIIALADEYAKLAKDPSGGTVFISQADCMADAEFLSKYLNEKHGVTVKSISDIGPVVGAHSGPGTLALFFIGSKR